MLLRSSDCIIDRPTIPSLQPGRTAAPYQLVEEIGPSVPAWVSGLYNGHLIQYHLYTVVCMTLTSPTNGVISYSDPTLGNATMATYSCNAGYTFIGGSTRTCGSDGVWSGSPPTCQGEFCNSCTVCVSEYTQVNPMKMCRIV